MQPHPNISLLSPPLLLSDLTTSVSTMTVSTSPLLTAHSTLPAHHPAPLRLLPIFPIALLYMIPTPKRKTKMMAPESPALARETTHCKSSQSAPHRCAKVPSNHPHDSNTVAAGPHHLASSSKHHDEAANGAWNAPSTCPIDSVIPRISFELTTPAKIHPTVIPSLRRASTQLSAIPPADPHPPALYLETGSGPVLIGAQHRRSCRARTPS